MFRIGPGPYNTFVRRMHQPCAHKAGVEFAVREVYDDEAVRVGMSTLLIFDLLKLTDADLEAVIVQLIESGQAPAADVLGRRLRAKEKKK